MSNVQIPQELAAFTKQIAGTVQPYIKVSAQKRSTALQQSKFAGNPYWPSTMEYPKDTQGKPMKLLAQLNFAELPKLNDFPEAGILQMFIAAEDDVMGINFDNMTEQADFRVVYHAEVIHDEGRLVTDFSNLDDLDTEYFPIQAELALSFQLEHEPVSVGDYRVHELLGGTVDLSQPVRAGAEEELWDVYAEAFSGAGHKIGGYPFFTQSDPREYAEDFLAHELLLLQIDSDDDAEIMWGDGGLANFFIRREDLQRLDFSKVIYNWDCF